MELFCQNSERLKAVNYFCKKAPSWVFNRALWFLLTLMTRKSQKVAKYLTIFPLNQKNKEKEFILYIFDKIFLVFPKIHKTWSIMSVQLCCLNNCFLYIICDEYFILKNQTQSRAINHLERTQNFPKKKKHFLPPDTHPYMCVPRGKKCYFFGKFQVRTK